MKGRTCVICGALGTTRWTLTNGDVASVADLCGEHSAPMNEAVAAAGLKPPAAVEEPSWETPVTRRLPRKGSFEPLAWEPPTKCPKQ